MEPPNPLPPGRRHPARRARLAAGVAGASAMVGITGWMAATQGASNPVVAAATAPAAATSAGTSATTSAAADDTTSTTVYTSPSTTVASAAVPAFPSTRARTSSRGS